MHGSTCRVVFGALTATAFFLGQDRPAMGRVEAEAILGDPFGIGRITIPLSPDDLSVVHTNAFALIEQDGRALYPVFSPGTLRRLLGEVLSTDAGQTPAAMTALFLFSGDAPLRLTVFTSQTQAMVVTPRRDSPRSSNRLRRLWWREYNAAARRQIAAGDYPPIVETYLTTMLGQRLGLDPPLLSRVKQQRPSELRKTLDLMFGVEGLRTAALRETLLGDSVLGGVADRPVPREIDWLAPEILPPRASVEIEPMARHVPEECFYIRFGTFANHLWLSHLLEEFGGDISRMINLRGHDAQLNARMQQQIALKQTKLSELLGGQVIADVAMIGRDLYLREGAAFGMLFQAKSGLLANDLRRQREEALKEHQQHGASLVTVKISGRDVSLLSTPDNRLRSYYAIDGDFHLVTTSKQIVQRFLEVGSGRGSLGDSEEFQHARSLMPVSRNDTVFVYFSSAFLRGLVSPQYQIELARRIQSLTEMELIQLARLAARAERRPGDSLEDLVAAGLLPSNFGRRADGSCPLLTDDRLIDSLRGARGTFTPIPDVELHRVTSTEESSYFARAQYYQNNWRQMDPLMIGIQRFALDKNGKERIVIDANVSPLDEQKYGWLMSLLGPPTPTHVTSAPGDIVNVHMSVKGGFLLPSVSAHQVFAAIQDVAPPQTDLLPTGFFKVLEILRTTPGYLGAWPKLGLLDLLPLGLAGEPDAAGFSRLPLGLWRRQFGYFSVLSFDPVILAEATPHLKPVEANSLAQIRIHVGDLSQSRLTGWLSGLNFQRAMQTTVGNLRLLHALTQQFHVPRAEALETAQKLLDAKLVCSLGGNYETVAHPGGVLTWQSSKLPELPVRRLPDDYQSPLLQWFRGLEVDLVKVNGRLMAHGQLDMQRREPEVAISLPFFNLFGGQKKVEEKEKENQPEEVPTPPATQSGSPQRKS